MNRDEIRAILRGVGLCGESNSKSAEVPASGRQRAGTRAPEDWRGVVDGNPGDLREVQR